MIVDGVHTDPDGWAADPNSADVVLSTHPAASHVGTRHSAGNYSFLFAGLSPILNDGDVVNVAINGAISSSAWSEWVERVLIRWPERGTDSANTVAPATPTDVANAQAAVLAKLPAALIGGRMDASVGAMASGVLTAAAIAAGALDGKGDWPVGKTGYELTTSQFNALVAAIEVELLNDSTGGALLAGIAAKVAELFDDAGLDLPPQIIAAAVRTNLATELARLDVAVSTRLASAGYTAPPSASAISTQVAGDLATAHGAGSWESADLSDVPTVAEFEARTLPAGEYGTAANQATLLSRISSGAATMFADLIAMITGSGVSPKFTTEALSNAPSGPGGGGSGDATLANQTAMIGQLTSIQAALAGGGLGYNGAVGDSGEITLVLGDDYETAISRQIVLPVSDPTGGVYDLLTAGGADAILFGAGSAKSPNLITGTIDAGEIVRDGGSGVTSIPIEIPSGGIDPAVQFNQRYGYRIRLQFGSPPAAKYHSPLGGWLTVEPEYCDTP